uniref:Uncharacterized protein n=1 Tax=Echinococcus granulosus TaxID=6210 RepID=A0A068WVQ7_ECHGR|nr:hypothetical protein EgrG_001173400 [Echinococcus granulosus]
MSQLVFQCSFLSTQNDQSNLPYLVMNGQFNRYMRDVSILFIVNSVANNFRHRKEPWSAFETPELCLGDYVLSQVPNNFSSTFDLSNDLFNSL